jgi:hypothetical protein
MSDLEIPPGERDCLAPTTACVICESLDLFLLDEGQGPTDKLYCSACGAVLRLELEAIQSA